MHQSVRDWVAEKMAGCESFGQVYEIGSLFVNGGVRDLVPHDRWLGIDIVDGEGVDLVCDAHEAPMPDASADLVVCLEMLEHDSDPVATMLTISRLLRPDHRALLTTRSEGMAYHHPPDLWRFDHGHIEQLAFTAGLNVLSSVDDPQPEHPGVLVELEKP